jgi:hypothetical protein
MKKNRMVSRIFRLSAVPAIALVLGLVLAGCDTGNGNDDGGGKTVTFTLTKLSPTSFSVKLDGANWKRYDDLVTNEFTSAQLFNIATAVLDDSSCTINSYPLSYFYNECVTKVSEDLKTITVTVPSGYTILGTLKFRSHEDLGPYAEQVTDGGITTMSGGDTNYVGTSLEEVTFP